MTFLNVSRVLSRRTSSPGTRTTVKLTLVTVDRILPSEEARDLLGLAAEIAQGELAPHASDYEERGEFPRDIMRTLGRAGLLGLVYPEADGGAGQPYETYLQVLEILAQSWVTVAESISVHTLSCFPVAAFGSEQQRKLLSFRD